MFNIICTILFILILLQRTWSNTYTDAIDIGWKDRWIGRCTLLWLLFFIKIQTVFQSVRTVSVLYCILVIFIKIRRLLNIIIRSIFYFRAVLNTVGLCEIFMNYLVVTHYANMWLFYKISVFSGYYLKYKFVIVIFSDKCCTFIRSRSSGEDFNVSFIQNYIFQTFIINYCSYFLLNYNCEVYDIKQSDIKVLFLIRNILFAQYYNFLQCYIPCIRLFLIPGK